MKAKEIIEKGKEELKNSEKGSVYVYVDEQGYKIKVEKL